MNTTGEEKTVSVEIYNYLKLNEKCIVKIPEFLQKRAFFAKRRMDEVKITPALPLTVHYRNERNQSKSDFDYWNIEFKGRSYVYRQVSTLQFLQGPLPLSFNFYYLKKIPD